MLAQEQSCGGRHEKLWIPLYKVSMRVKEAWCEADDREKGIASNDFWIFNRHMQWRPDNMSPFAR